MMRRGLITAMLIAAFAAAGTPAEAQVKLKPMQQRIQVQKPPRVNKPPAAILPIKPSQALSIASRTLPNAKPVGVKLLNNKNYVVTLRKNNVVTRVIVNAQTGAID